MTTEGSDESGQESGGALRDNLEATNAENKVLREALTANVVGRFKYVSPEDLAGVAPNDLDAKAAEIEQTRTGERQSLLTEELTARGLTEAQIAEIVGQSSGAAPTPPAASTSLGNVGKPPTKVKPGTEDGLYGPDRIRAALGG